MTSVATRRPPLVRAVRALAPYAVVRFYDSIWPEWRAFDLDRVELLRTAPPDLLRDAARLEHELLPRLGLAGTIPEAFPPALRPHLGTGLHPFQWPCQLAPYLVALSRLPIRTYLELGVFQGGTFVITVEYLRRTTGLQRAVAVDIDRMLGTRRYARRARGVEVVQMASGTPDFDRLVQGVRPDLVLIDADHSLAAVRRDWESVRDVAPVVAFHDIIDNASPGVRRFWREVREQHADEWVFEEFTAQYDDVVERIGGQLLGIGLAVRKDIAER